MYEGAANGGRSRAAAASAQRFFARAFSVSVLVVVFDCPLTVSLMAAPRRRASSDFLSNERPVAESLTLTALLLPASTENETVPSFTVVAFFLPLTFLVTLVVSAIVPVHAFPPLGHLTVKDAVPLASTLAAPRRRASGT